MNDKPVRTYLDGTPEGCVGVQKAKTETTDVTEMSVEEQMRYCTLRIRRALGYGPDQDVAMDLEIEKAKKRHIDDGPAYKNMLDAIEKLGVPVPLEEWYNLTEVRDFMAVPPSVRGQPVPKSTTSPKETSMSTNETTLENPTVLINGVDVTWWIVPGSIKITEPDIQVTDTQRNCCFTLDNRYDAFILKAENLCQGGAPWGGWWNDAKQALYEQKLAAGGFSLSPDTCVLHGGDHVVIPYPRDLDDNPFQTPLFEGGLEDYHSSDDFISGRRTIAVQCSTARKYRVDPYPVVKQADPFQQHDPILEYYKASVGEPGIITRANNMGTQITTRKSDPHTAASTMNQHNPATAPYFQVLVNGHDVTAQVRRETFHCEASLHNGFIEFELAHVEGDRSHLLEHRDHVIVRYPWDPNPFQIPLFDGYLVKPAVQKDSDPWTQYRAEAGQVVANSHGECGNQYPQNAGLFTSETDQQEAWEQLTRTKMAALGVQTVSNDATPQQIYKQVDDFFRSDHGGDWVGKCTGSAQNFLYVTNEQYELILHGDDGDDVLTLRLQHRGPDNTEPVMQPVLVVKRWGEVEVMSGWHKRMGDLAQKFWAAVAQVHHDLPAPVSPKQEAILAFCNEHHMNLAEFDRGYTMMPDDLPVAGGAPQKWTATFLTEVHRARYDLVDARGVYVLNTGFRDGVDTQ